jgi:hypothetical protein
MYEMQSQYQNVFVVVLQHNSVMSNASSMDTEVSDFEWDIYYSSFTLQTYGAHADISQITHKQ